MALHILNLYTRMINLKPRPLYHHGNAK